MISEDVVSPNQGSIGLVAVLSLIFLFLGKVGENTSSKRRPKTRDILQTTTSPDISSESSGGLTIEATSPTLDDASTPIASPKPQQVRAARRKREYVSYPINLDGGSYADTYLQLNKDIVLKLRSALWNGKGLLALPGNTIPSLEISEEKITSSKSSSVAVAEPTATVATPTVPTITPVETDSDFDFEWE